MPSPFKDRGAFYFWAIDLLGKTLPVHGVHHDLESLYWVLLWVILRWIKHDLVSDTSTEEPCDSVYYYGGDAKARRLKVAWLMDPDDTPLKVVGNEPLTTLHEDLRVLLGRNMRARTEGQQPITHEEVLKLLDDAPKKDGWPARSGDSAVRYARLNQAPSTDVCGQKRLASTLDTENPSTHSEEPRSKKSRSKGANGSKKGATGSKRGEGSRGGRSKGGRGRNDTKSKSTLLSRS